MAVPAPAIPTAAARGAEPRCALQQTTPVERGGGGGRVGGRVVEEGMAESMAATLPPASERHGIAKRGAGEARTTVR